MTVYTKAAKRSVYTGRAISKIKTQNEEQDKKLTDWSYKTKMDGFKMWEGVEISFHQLSVHECQNARSLDAKKKSSR